MSPVEKDAAAMAARIERQFTGSPLSPIGERLLDLLTGALSAVRAGHAERNLSAALAAIDRIVALLPSSFGERFPVDATVIHEVLDSFARGGVVSFSGAFVPRYTGEWGYYQVPMPSEGGERTHVVCVTTFVGSDRTDDLELSEYTWLLHELAHDCLYRIGSQFREAVGAVIQERARSLRFRAAADVGVARQRAIEHIERIESYWSAVANQIDWSHEVACDILALYVAGPAHASSVRRAVASTNLDRITKQHPSYRIRLQALVVACNALGWTDEAIGIGEALRVAPATDSATTIYGDGDILRGVVLAALALCRVLALPPMTPNRLNRLMSISEGPGRMSMIDAIAVAAPLKGRLDARDYAIWHRRVLGLDL